MSHDRLLMRPADPTARPRFHEDGGRVVDLEMHGERRRRVLRLALAALALLTIAAVVAAIGPLPWWAPVAPGAALVVFIAALRRAEVQRRAARARARALAEEREWTPGSGRSSRDGGAAAGSTVVRSSAGQVGPRHLADPSGRGAVSASAAGDTEFGSGRVSAADADHVSDADAPQTAPAQAARALQPGEWMPRPVPVPTYSLRGAVDDLGTRHDQHRSMVAAVTALERDGVEEIEADDESRRVGYRVVPGAAAGFAAPAELHLDEVLERRRA
ncbi:hypothetical protein JSY14_11545 [Brachybacterium sp. EF45031]|uniref:hypothetical protein n=1 Tax=Brachybacterium sillae TaxID=2810536 RepID=UPI00217D3E27|nr:hypothetical protein [Brachybacterium sillae]MCS6712624.1 hypothetical protein [Brachybacterium sillae]